MRTTVRKWGRGLGVGIPNNFASQLGLNAGSEVEITVEGQALRVAPAGALRYTLELLLEGVTPENLQAEVDAGPPFGSELGAASAMEDETAYLLRPLANRNRLLAAVRNVENTHGQPALLWSDRAPLK